MTGEEETIAGLPVWEGRPQIEPLSGGITNQNFLVTDAKKKAVVRLGVDIPVHHVIRRHELAASRAAHAAGISPAVLHHEPGVLVLDYIEGKTLSAEDIRGEAMLARILPLLHGCHEEIPKYLEGPAVMFWVFHVIRDYARTLARAESPYASDLPRLLEVAARLEEAAGPFEIRFGHNDLLAANFIDDGKRLWLIDWDYAGFNSPLFDLGGLASNNAFSRVQERALLEAYFSAPVDAALLRRFDAMKAASLLRETMWSMVSELFSTIDFDYASYTRTNRAAFETAYNAFTQSQEI
ncbi:MAG: choline kinase [Alphaproteobacteria bacterium]|nr:MAG: choline kinase [Alphaproteobacteria bacterium]